jgi:hypothetical protein
MCAAVDHRCQAGAGGLVADSVHRRRGRRSGNDRSEIDASECDLALGGRPCGGERRELRGHRIRDYREHVSGHSRRWADVVTLGNHSWNRKEALSFIGTEPRLVRPLNYVPGTPGQGFVRVETARGKRVLVLNALGRKC